MRDTTANVGMTPTSKNSMAVSAAAAKTRDHQFERPKIEFPVNLREFAKEVMARTRGNYEQIETAANEMMSVLVRTQSTTAKSIVNYRTCLMKVARGNVIAAFDFARNLATATSVPDVIEYSREHARIQFDALEAQTRELTDLARNVAIGRADQCEHRQCRENAA